MNSYILRTYNIGNVHLFLVSNMNAFSKTIKQFCQSVFTKNIHRLWLLITINKYIEQLLHLHKMLTCKIYYMKKLWCFHLLFLETCSLSYSINLSCLSLICQNFAYSVQPCLDGECFTQFRMKDYSVKHIVAYYYWNTFIKYEMALKWIEIRCTSNQ